MKLPQFLNTLRQQLVSAHYAPEEARSLSRWLAAYLIGCPLRELPLYTQRDLDIQAAAPYLARLQQGEPLQYILGETEFMGLRLFCSPAALIPRGDSECLLEAAIELLREHPAPLLADICCGSGAFGLAAAAYLPRARADIADISAAALAVAERNVQALGLTERVRLYQGDLLAALPAGQCYDMLLCNPPYIPSATLSSLPALAAEPALALDGGADGLDFYRRLALDAPPRLLPGGKLLLEHGDDQSAAVSSILTAAGWQILANYSDYGGRARGILCTPK